MQGYKKILYVIMDLKVPEGMDQAFEFAKANGAHLNILILHTPFPTGMQFLEKNYGAELEQELKGKLAEYGLEDRSSVSYESQKPFFVTIIQAAMREGCDLVIKDAENPGLIKKKRRGLKSLDMSLLRKCPCPVWLQKTSVSESSPLIVTAVDASEDAEMDPDLNIRLLAIGASLSRIFGARYHVVSAWEFEYEGFARNAPFARVSDEKVDEMIETERMHHYAMLEDIIKKAPDLPEHEVVQERGAAQDVIPDYAEREKADIVVMGTVARTGIPGFMIGNTAENILQDLECSMFTAKPADFETPVKIK